MGSYTRKIWDRGSSPRATVTRVNRSTVSIPLLLFNPDREGVIICNDATRVLYVKLGVGASLTSYSLRIDPNTCVAIPFLYTGRIDGIWETGGGTSGGASITELS